MEAADKPLAEKQPTGQTPVSPGQVPGTNDEGGSEAGREASEPRFLTVGQVVGVHGIRGEIKVDLIADDPDRFQTVDRVLIGPVDQEPVPWPIEAARSHKGRALLKLEGCEDRNCAEMLRGQLVHVAIEAAVPLEAEEYYEHQILDLEVWTGGGERLGTVVEILYTGANEVYVIETDSGSEVLIPAIDSVVRSIDLEAGRIIVDLLEGLM
ncbi:MAG TPA: ribosome maturation factor RimM [Anaerolineae bacterium]|nr:ribosome maturation factor RimM [Anaerolineae bacterium]